VADEEIGKREVISITEIFPQKGEQYFCEAEHRFPGGICGRSGRVVERVQTD